MWATVSRAGFPEGVFRPANSGRYFSTGSSRPRRPSSTSIITAAPVTGFDIEAIKNTVSGFIGLPEATSANPVHSSWRMPSEPAISITAPAISPASTRA